MGKTLAMTNARAWRLADLTFVPLGDGRERAAINDEVEIVKQNDRYWIMTPNGPQWHDISEGGVDPALNFLFIEHALAHGPDKGRHGGR